MPVYKNEENNSWYIRTYIKDKDGKSKQIKRHNKDWVGRDGKRKAEIHEAKLKDSSIKKTSDEQKENTKKEDVKKVLFDDIVKKYLSEQNKHNKEDTYYDRCVLVHERILPHFTNKEVDSITKNDILLWHNDLDNRNYSINYKQKCHMVLDNILQIGIKFFNLNVNVANQIGNFKTTKDEKEKITENEEKIKYINFEEFKQFISVIDDFFWKTFFHVLYFTGVRKGEIQALTWNDIDFKNKKIKVTKTLVTKCFNVKWKVTSTKNLKNRTIDIDDNTIRTLKEFYNIRKKEKDFNLDDFVFGNNKEPLKNHRIDYQKDRYFELSNVKNITIHQFRHSHVSLMINEYLKAGQTDTKKFFIMMSNRMGHTIEVMERTYLHFFPDVQTPIVNLINCLNCN